MSTPRYADWIEAGRTEVRPRSDRALRIVVAIGIVVFCLALATLARGYITGHGLDEVALFWGAWSLVAGSLALVLRRLPR